MQTKSGAQKGSQVRQYARLFGETLGIPIGRVRLHARSKNGWTTGAYITIPSVILEKLNWANGQHVGFEIKKGSLIVNLLEVTVRFKEPGDK